MPAILGDLLREVVLCLCSAVHAPDSSAVLEALLRTVAVHSMQ